MGAECAVIGQTLRVSLCPLARGACFFQHRASNACKAKELTGEKNVNTMLEILGDPVRLTPQSIKQSIDNIKQAIKEQL